MRAYNYMNRMFPACLRIYGIKIVLSDDTRPAAFKIGNHRGIMYQTAQSVYSLVFFLRIEKF